jgi:hypothetical protein
MYRWSLWGGLDPLTAEARPAMKDYPLYRKALVYRHRPSTQRGRGRRTSTLNPCMHAGDLKLAARKADDLGMTVIAAMTDAQVRAAQVVIVGSVVGFIVLLLVVRFWVWVIVQFAVHDLRRKNVLPGLTWEQALPAALTPGPATTSQLDRGREWASQVR